MDFPFELARVSFLVALAIASVVFGVVLVHRWGYEQGWNAATDHCVRMFSFKRITTFSLTEVERLKREGKYPYDQ